MDKVNLLSKLSLAKETLRSLSQPDLSGVAGGSNQYTEFINRCLTTSCPSGSRKGVTWICAE